ncbi:sulfotransferase family protein [Allosediminivita pacifica]|uniref:Sulfotransferase family protein n=1 Tax=Allosediminivita pacifica TaxID=1267769 RepID=A0A2T6A954_9RHOB|nr:sulfotransferase family protein [Allosediminivita pacifica]
MFILHSSRTMFVHIPKAAGMHVSKSFRSKAAPGDVFLTGPRVEVVGAPLRSRILNEFRAAKTRLGRPIPLKHSSAEELRGFFPGIFDDYRTFCVVRDPVARAISAYTYAKNDAKTPAVPRTREAFEAIRSCQSFDEFVLGGLSRGSWTSISCAPNRILCSHETAHASWMRSCPPAGLIRHFERVSVWNPRRRRKTRPPMPSARR